MKGCCELFFAVPHPPPLPVISVHTKRRSRKEPNSRQNGVILGRNLVRAEVLPSRAFFPLLFGLGELMRNQLFQSALVCVFLCRRVRLPMFRAAVENTDSGLLLVLAFVCASNCSSRLRFRDLHPDLFWESYPYRIGTVHMCRDAAYADAGVLPGALQLFCW